MAEPQGQSSTLIESAERSLEHLLSPYQQDAPGQRVRLSESDVKQISSLLQYLDKPSWARVPRLYVVLRLVKHVHIIDSFIAQGISDIWFPFSLKTLPESLRSASARYDFIELQDVVLTKAFDLEREDGKHRDLVDYRVSSATFSSFPNSFMTILLTFDLQFFERPRIGAMPSSPRVVLE